MFISRNIMHVFAVLSLGQFFLIVTSRKLEDTEQEKAEEQREITHIKDNYQQQQQQHHQQQEQQQLYHQQQQQQHYYQQQQQQYYHHNHHQQQQHHKQLQKHHNHQQNQQKQQQQNHHHQQQKHKQKRNANILKEMDPTDKNYAEKNKQPQQHEISMKEQDESHSDLNPILTSNDDYSWEAEGESDSSSFKEIDDELPTESITMINIPEADDESDYASGFGANVTFTTSETDSKIADDTIYLVIIGILIFMLTVTLASITLWRRLCCHKMKEFLCKRSTQTTESQYESPQDKTESTHVYEELDTYLEPV